MDIVTIIGILGTGILVITFILNENHKLNVDDLTFDVLHLFGSLFLVIYAVEYELYIFVVLNGIASFVSLRDVIKGLTDKPKSKTRSAIIRHKRRASKLSIWSIFKKPPRNPKNQ